MNNSADNMKSDQMVSVIMPAYNSEKFVAEAIESVLSQTHSNWQLLAIDDGSTDATGKIIDSYAARDARISVFHTENKGVSHARNVGLDNAIGEWVAFLDSDDLLTSDALADLLAASDGMDLVVGNYYEFPQLRQKFYLEDAYFSDKTKPVPLLTGIGAAWGMIFRRGAVRERFLLGLQYGEDTVFLYDFLVRCVHVATIHNVVYGCRRGVENSLSHHQENASLACVEHLCHAACKLLNGEVDSYHAFAAHYFVFYVRGFVQLSNLAAAENSTRILEVLESEYFREIPMTQLSLPAKEMHLFAILKTGDITLIENEFKHACKR